MKEHYLVCFNFTNEINIIMTTTTNKPPIWFWIASIFALIWNAMGINQYLQQAYNTESFVAFYTPEQLVLAYSYPA
jgi:hypothetical protein